MVVSYRWSFEVDSHTGQVAVFHTDPGSFSQLLENASESFTEAVDNAAREYLVSAFAIHTFLTTHVAVWYVFLQSSVRM